MGILCEKKRKKAVYGKIKKIANDLMDSVQDINDDIMLFCTGVVNLKVWVKKEIDSNNG